LVVVEGQMDDAVRPGGDVEGGLDGCKAMADNLGGRRRTKPALGQSRA
jgi:hypothetical protein